jgi:hypothetical protein
VPSPTCCVRRAQAWRTLAHSDVSRQKLGVDRVPAAFLNHVARALSVRTETKGRIDAGNHVVHMHSMR